MDKKKENLFFTRGEVASMLGCDRQTIANRESSGVYPEPKRALNNYRIYTLDDVISLQMISLGTLNIKSIASVMHDKGWTDVDEVSVMIDQALMKKGFKIE